MAYEAIKIEYDNVVVYTETDSNVVGATTDTTLRTILTHSDANCIYVNGATGSDAGAGTAAAPKATIGGAETACDGTHQMITILDSGYYDEVVTVDNANCNTIQADLGQTPTLTRKPGARVSSTPAAVTGTEYFVKKTGNNGNTGLSEGQAWLTIQYALSTIASGDTITICDSNTYDEALTAVPATSLVLRAKKGQTPTVTNSTNDSPIIQWLADATAARTMTIDGLIFHGADRFTTYAGILAYRNAGANGVTVTVNNCTFQNFRSTGNGITVLVAVTLVVTRSLFSGTGSRGIYAYSTCPTITISDCTLHGWAGYGIYIACTAVATATTITDCMLYRNGSNVRVDDDSTTDTIVITNCTSVQPTGSSTAGYGRCYDINRHTTGGGDTCTITGCIAYSYYASSYDFDFNMATTVTYCAGAALKSVNTTYTSGFGGGLTMADVNNRFFGLLPESGGYRAGNAGGDYDMGVRWTLLKLDRNAVTINGLIFDGGDSWLTGVGHYGGQTDTACYWCTFHNFSGIALDAYNASATPTGLIVNSCSIHRSGCGVVCFGLDFVYYSLIYRCRYYGVYEDGADLAMNHCTFYGNTNYGLFFTTTGAASLVQHTIFSATTGYGIYSGTNAIVLDECAIDDAYSSLVDISDPDNYIVAPYFRSIEDGAEDFHFATVAGGYAFPEGQDNVLLDTGVDDDGDADAGETYGAYATVSAVVSNTWSSYTLPYNPLRMDVERAPVNFSEHYNTSAVYSSFADNYRVRLTMAWGDDFNMPLAQSELLEYLGRLHTRMRIHLADSAGLFSATGTTNATAKTFTPSVAPGWTPMRWAGWWLLYDGVAYKILSNTTTALLLDDPDDVLASSTKTGKITFIEVKRVGSVVVTPQQKYYDRQADGSEIPRTGVKIDFVEV